MIGGQAPKAIRSVECYDFKDDRWFQLAEMPSRRCRCGMFVAQSSHVITIIFTMETLTSDGISLGTDLFV